MGRFYVNKRNELVQGVGINDAGYVVKDCPFYQRWRDMLRRCYSTDQYHTYKNCSVCNEWLTFSNFMNWMKIQNWENKQLDKDLLIPGNKVYSPETCIFVNKTINMFIVDSGKVRGKWPLGVYFNKRDNKFMARCKNPFTDKDEFLGYFTCPQEAHKAWRKRKYELACELSESEFVDDERLIQALQVKYL